MKDKYLKRKRKLLDGRLKSDNYIDDLEENLEENLEEEVGQNIRLDKKEIERKMMEDIENMAKAKTENKKKKSNRCIGGREL